VSVKIRAFGLVGKKDSVLWYIISVKNGAGKAFYVLAGSLKPAGHLNYRNFKVFLMIILMLTVRDVKLRIILVSPSRK
jgi:hypothetical protein